MEKNKVEWSDEQLNAITTRNKNLLVSASAGSGKTTVMIARILELLKEGESLDKMLICTYTRASAADMKEKLYKKLLEEKEKCADKTVIEKQISLIPIADISTIDSWCIKIVRNYFYVIDTDPAFEILEERESVAMLGRCIESTLNEFLQKQDNKDFLALYESLYKNRKDKNFRDIITRIYNFANTQVNPKKWLENSLDLYNGGYIEKCEKFIQKHKNILINKGLLLLEELLNANESKAYVALETLISQFSHDEELEKTSYAKDAVLKIKGQDYKKSLEGFIEEREKLSSVGPIDARYAKQIVDFTLSVIEKLEKEKERKGALDFADCEHKAYEILQREDILSELKDKYSFVFVDEYQDANPLQEAIISMLQKDGNMFYVGDVKQSIYAFRNSDPTIFTYLYDNFDKRGFAQPINFVTNYRCGKNIVDFVNGVFNPLMTRDFGGVDYKSNPLLHHASKGDGEVKTTIFKTEKTTEVIEEDYSIFNEEKASKTERIASYILSDIAENLNKVKANGEKTTFSDIAILVRKRSALAYELYEKMQSAGMSVHMSKELNFSSNPAVRYILDMLAFIDDNENEIAFVSSISSPFFLVTASDLYALRKLGKYKENLVHIARRYAKENSDELSQKLITVFDFFDKYSEFSITSSVKDTVSSIIVELDYFNALITSNKYADANLLSMFLDSLNSCAYADTLSSYLKFIEDGGDKCEIKPEDDCINIMTMHSSKGLEFPFVYIIDADNTFNSNKESFCSTHKELGLGVKTLNEQERTIEENPLYNLIKKEKQNSENEERARLLYVALTRAQEGLYIYATVQQTKQRDFFAGVPSTANSFFGWMSETILATGYKTINVDDIEVVDFAKNNKIIDLSLADEKFVKVLSKRFEKMEEIYKGVGQNTLKTSVTFLANEEAENQIPAIDNERISYANSSGVDPLKKGNAYHKTMELLSFSLPFEDAYAQVEKAEIEDFNLVEKSKIEKCYNKILPLINGAKIYKEKSFIYNDNGRLVQGIIDLFLLKDDEVVIIDYKTSSLFNLSQEKTLLEYRVQVGIYAKAVEEIMNKKVTSVMLYSFEKGDFIQL